MLTSVLRTVVPALWGAIIGWVLTILPVLEPLREQLLEYGSAAVPFIAALLIGAWYALWRKLEPRLPDWLTTILLGSAKTPVYPPAKVTSTHAEPGERVRGVVQDYEPKHLADD